MSSPISELPPQAEPIKQIFQNLTWLSSLPPGDLSKVKKVHSEGCRAPWPRLSVLCPYQRTWVNVITWKGKCRAKTLSPFGRCTTTLLNCWRTIRQMKFFVEILERFTGKNPNHLILQIKNIMKIPEEYISCNFFK